MPASLFSELSEILLASELESCGVLYVRSGGPRGFVAAGWSAASDDAYLERTGHSAVLRPEWVFDVSRIARESTMSVCLIHTHPFGPGQPRFSPVDDAGEPSIAAFLKYRTGVQDHLTLVLGREGVTCRHLSNHSAVEVWSVGQRLARLDGALPTPEVHKRHDRQVRAFGAGGQRAISRLTVAIVGLGGTGSATVQQLAHLGVERFVLIDPDRVEEHNLNRLVGGTLEDVHSPKAQVAERMIRSIVKESRVDAIGRDVVDSDVAQRLLEADFIFCCTDSHASRAVINQVSYQYLIPAIDMGVSLGVTDGEVASITGRVQMLAPGLACLTCTNAIDANAVRTELMTPEQRNADPYFIDGPGVPQPAVISLNSTVASLAINMFLGAVTEAPFGARFQLYDGVRGIVRSVAASADPSCIVCSPRGAFTRGVGWPLPVRQAPSVSTAAGI